MKRNPNARKSTFTPVPSASSMTIMAAPRVPTSAYPAPSSHTMVVVFASKRSFRLRRARRLTHSKVPKVENDPANTAHNPTHGVPVTTMESRHTNGPAKRATTAVKRTSQCSFASSCAYPPLGSREVTVNAEHRPSRLPKVQIAVIVQAALAPSTTAEENTDIAVSARSPTFSPIPFFTFLSHDGSASRSRFPRMARPTGVAHSGQRISAVNPRRL